MADLPSVFLSDAARVAVIGMPAEQRRKLVHTLRSLQRDPEIGLPHPLGGDMSGRVVVVPGDEAVPGMTLIYRIRAEEIRVVHILAGP
ncbi:hypothetical protein [Kitasatospora sp. NBC_01302]|uniref:hypothetical protein n=1 Tax=Kitasatospora sp. NBC_01302 TaxID=2903575 RepID=UPI002E106242|nr:hypothetical protein OG294_14160 [Kitasatospora sp. NBC_01302]